MNRIVLAGLRGLALASIVSCNSASRDAGAFTSAGVAHLEQGEYDRAIRDFDRALALQPGFVVAWKNRALAYKGKGDLERAIADYDQAILLAPTDAKIINDRGAAYFGLNDFTRAIQDFDRAVALKPDQATAMKNRGRAHFILGNFAQAAADLQRGLALDSADAQATLWLHLARRRLSQDDAADFAAHAGAADSTRWPAPVLRYFLGAISAEQLRVAATDSTGAPEQSTDAPCVVSFYLGESALLRGARDEATELFRETRASCPKDGGEHKAAVAELQRLRSKSASWRTPMATRQVT